MSASKPLTFSTLAGGAIVLSGEQEAAYRDVLAGRNVLITGQAGTGKSTLLTLLSAKYGDRLAVTASTGIAALGVGGTTINTFAGLGLGDSRAATIARHILEDKGRAHRNITQCKILALDEVSMVSASLFTLVDQVFRMVRKLDVPFGGVQLVALGDFLQLPPISNRRRGEAEAKFAFECEAWEEASIHVHLLTRVYRQANQPFADALGCLRVGDIHNPLVDLIASRKGLLPPNDGIRPTIVHTHNVDVERINLGELAKLPGKEYSYFSIDTGKHAAVERLDRDCLAPKELKLKVGAQVMLLANIDIEASLVNGRLGVVTELEDGDITVRFGTSQEACLAHHKWNVMNGKEIMATRAQFPLKLAYAITAHKCVAADTRIATDRGLMRVKDIAEMTTCPANHIAQVTSGIRVHGRHGLAHVGEVFRGVTELGYKITTRQGYEITASERHPLLRFSVGGVEEFIVTPKIKVGDAIRLRAGAGAEGDGVIRAFQERPAYRNSLEYTLPDRVTDELAWLLGCVIGDGCVTDWRDGRVDLTNMEPEVLARFKQTVRECFALTVSERPTITKARLSYFHSKGVRDYLEYIGLGYNTARDKHVPEIIFRSPVSAQRAFLRGLFSTDGGVNGGVHLTTSSRRMAGEIHLMLLNLGMRSSLAPLGDSAWRIAIYGSNVVEFIQRIGFDVGYKQAAGLRLASRSQGCASIKSNLGVVPNGRRLGKALREEIASRYGYRYGKTMRLKVAPHISTLLSRVIAGKSSLHDPMLLSILAAIPDAETCGPVCAALLGAAKRGIITDEIVSIERVEAEMMDIGVPDDNTFIGGGFVNHNCQGLTLDRIVCHLGKTFDYGQAYVAVSRVRTLEGLYLVGATRHNFRPHPKALAFYANARRNVTPPPAIARQDELALV